MDLNERISKIPDNTTCYIRGYTKIANDIVRVRAELNDLKGMINK